MVGWFRQAVAPLALRLPCIRKGANMGRSVPSLGKGASAAHESLALSGLGGARCPLVRCRRFQVCAVPRALARVVCSRRPQVATRQVRQVVDWVRSPGIGRALLPCLRASSLPGSAEASRKPGMPLWRVWRHRQPLAVRAPTNCPRMREYPRRVQLPAPKGRMRRGLEVVRSDVTSRVR